MADAPRANGFLRRFSNRNGGGDTEEVVITERTEAGLRRAHGPGGRNKAPMDPVEPAEQTLKYRAKQAALKVFPAAIWLPKYGRHDLVGDLVSGLTVSVVLIPQAIAYALLVEIPPVYGLYTSLVPLLVYVFTGTSRQMCIGPFALVSLVVASLVNNVLPPERTPEEYINGVLVLTIFTGVIQVIMGLLGLGIVASLLADPAIAGFTTAVALIIISSQLKYFLGAPIPRGSMPVTIYHGLVVLFTGQANWWAVVTTILAFLFMYSLKTGGKRFCPKVPLFEQLLAVVLFTGISYAIDPPLEIVGEIPSGLPAPTVPHIPWSLGASFLQAGAICAFTSYLVSMSIVRIFATKHGYPVNANTELVALGLSNVVGGFFRAYPSSGSFSRSAIVSSLGGRTPMHGVVQVVVIGLVLLVLTPLFQPLPYAVLAAIIFAALQSLVDFSSAKKLWKSSRSDFWLWVIGFVSTAILDVQTGLILSLVASLGLLVMRTSRPRWLVLGRLPGTDVFRDVRRYPTARTRPGVLIFRFDAPLHFANAEYFVTSLRGRMRAMAKEGNPVTHVVIDASSIHTIDSSAHDVLVKLVKELHGNDVAFLIASSRAPFREALQSFGSYDTVFGENNMFLTLVDAVEVGCNRPRELPIRRGASQMQHIGVDVDADYRGSIPTPPATAPVQAEQQAVEESRAAAVAPEQNGAR